LQGAATFRDEAIIIFPPFSFSARHCTQIIGKIKLKSSKIIKKIFSSMFNTYLLFGTVQAKLLSSSAAVCLVSPPQFLKIVVVRLHFLDPSLRPIPF
jgi:hypothetical protein